MNTIAKIGTGILGIVATIACLATVGILGYALLGKQPAKTAKETEQVQVQEAEEAQALEQEQQEAKILTENVPTVAPAHVHNYVESTDIKANCLQAGRLKFTCDICGDTYYQDIPKGAHYPDTEWVMKREPTANLVGLRVKYCIYCDEIVAMEDIPYGSGYSNTNTNNAGHVHDFTVDIEREPTCILAGLKKYTCSCGYFYTEPISAPGHVASDWTTVQEASAGKMGSQQITCTVCGAVLDSRPVAATASPSPSTSANSTSSPAATATPTTAPTAAPVPTTVPTKTPTGTPSPTVKPTAKPTPTPTVRPTVMPTGRPTSTPTPTGSATPSSLPTPSAMPSVTPTSTPGTSPEYTYGDMTFYTYLGDDGQKLFCLIQPIINTGTKPIYLKTGSVTLTDVKGNKVSLEKNGHLQSFTDVVMPGKTGYFHNVYKDRIDGYSEPFTPEISLEIDEAKEDEVVYPVSDIKIYKGERNNPIITGMVTNNTNENNPSFYINVIFRDKSGAIIGMTGDNSDEGSGIGLLIPAGETKPFTLNRSWNSITGNFTYEDIDINNLEVITSRRHKQ